MPPEQLRLVDEQQQKPGHTNQAENRLSFTELLSDYKPKTVSGLDNQTEVLSRLLPSVPGAIGEALSDDWHNHKGALAGKVAISTGLGLASAICLARSPLLAKSLLGLSGAAGGLWALKGTAGFAYDAWKADSEDEKNALVTSGKAALGRIGADLLETTPGFLAGTRAGLSMSKGFTSLDSFALSVRDRVNMPLQERLHFMGRGSKTLTGLAAEEGSGINLLKAADEMAQAHPWKGVEELRLFKPGKTEGTMNLGAAVKGAADDVSAGGGFDHSFHTHGSRVLPTSGDFTQLKGTGVISIPERGLLTFFDGVGARAQAAERLLVAGEARAGLAAEAALKGETYSSLVVDRTRQLAVRVDSLWDSKLGLTPKGVQPLDYSQVMQRLTTWNGKSIGIADLQMSTKALTADGMTDLLRTIASHH